MGTRLGLGWLWCGLGSFMGKWNRHYYGSDDLPGRARSGHDGRPSAKARIPRHIDADGQFKAREEYQKARESRHRSLCKVPAAALAPIADWGKDAFCDWIPVRVQGMLCGTSDSTSDHSSGLIVSCAFDTLEQSTEVAFSGGTSAVSIRLA